LLEAVASHLLLAGYAYIEAVGPGNESLQVRELYALRPQRTVDHKPTHFDQGAALPPILHLTFFNPLEITTV
jgi:hypothetical protein